VIRRGIAFDCTSTIGGIYVEVLGGRRWCGRMAYLWKRWDARQSRFGDAVVIGFLLVQCLDGVLTYLGVSIWGRGIEANPLVSLAIAAGGLGTGLAATKLVALLTAIYVAAAILPWTALFLTN
jgi:hypothetical protein